MHIESMPGYVDHVYSPTFLFLTTFLFDWDLDNIFGRPTGNSLALGLELGFGFIWIAGM